MLCNAHRRALRSYAESSVLLRLFWNLVKLIELHDGDNDYNIAGNYAYIDFYLLSRNY